MTEPTPSGGKISTTRTDNQALNRFMIEGSKGVYRAILADLLKCRSVNHGGPMNLDELTGRVAQVVMLQ